MEPKRRIAELTAQSLAGIEVLRDLSAEDRGVVAGYCSGFRYAEGQQVVSHRESTTDVYFIISGAVRITLFSLSGKQVTFGDMVAGQMFGELAAIDGKRRSAYALTLSDSFIASMTADGYREVLRRYPSVAEAALRRLAGLVRLLSDRVFELSTLGVKNRIHAELLRLSRAHMTGANTARIAPVPTHAEIASHISSHREAVTRELNSLSRAGLVEKRSGSLVVNDVDRLRRLVEDVMGEAEASDET